MKNLYIMHTQYNLILSAAVMSRNPIDHNTLILHAEFAVTDEMMSALQQLFDRVFVITDRFVPTPKKPLDEIRLIRAYVKKVNAIKKERFDCIYMSQERIFDMIICERVKRRNPEALCYAIEEDAYYSLNNRYNDPSYRHILTRNQRRRRFLYAMCLLGYPYNYKDVHYCYGMSAEYHGANLLFVNLARKELSGKQLNEITKEELLSGIQAIYKNRKTVYPKADKYMIMFFDLLSRYKNPELVKDTVRAVAKRCETEGRCILMKYHPRETEKFTEFENVFEIDKVIPAEKVLYDLQEYDVSVFGNATTACIVAAKLGYTVNSICRIEVPDNTKMHETMAAMGVHCITSVDDLKM